MLNRRQFLQVAGAGLASAQSRRPNIVFLLTDDQRWDSLGCMGNRIVRTPHIDSLAAAGVTFENHFVTTAICVVSRASIFTGLHAHCHGIREFKDPFPQELFARSYPALLRESGYRTGFIGKWGIDGGQMPSSQFDYFRGFQGQGRYFPEGGSRHLTSIMGDQALEFLRESPGDRPFCLSVSFKAPHVEDPAPEQFLPDPRDMNLYRDVVIPPPATGDTRYLSALPLSIQRSEGRRRWGVRFSTPELYQTSVKNYYRLISGIDREVGRILAQLDAGGQRRNTIMVYSSDNGFYLGEHGLAGKWYMHEESIRVPMIVHDPAAPSARRGVRMPEMTLNIDIAPTLLGLAGAPAPASMQGRDLRPLLAGNGSPWRRDWFYEHHFRSGGWIPATEGVRTGRWKYTRYIDEQPAFEELFDLRQDRLETRNLARDAKHAETLSMLRRRRETWLESLRAWKPDRPWQDPTELAATL